MASDAMSYFVGNDAVDAGYEEDGGFAINGAMGNYYFTCATTGSKTKVEYTFGYKKNFDGQVRIFVPHSTGGPAPKLAVTEKEVKQAQAARASAIKTISSVYKSGGDYVQAASNAAAELYGYGHSQVLFKPTKAAEFPFRPTGGEAMSYFVGKDAVEDGYEEDAGFAINGGKGWADVVFDNHAIDLNGNTATAMGTYYFTCATTGDKVKVEYTFGYKKNADGKARIYLHHSSVPYNPAPASPGLFWLACRFLCNGCTWRCL